MPSQERRFSEKQEGECHPQRKLRASPSAARSASSLPLCSLRGRGGERLEEGCASAAGLSGGSFVFGSGQGQRLLHAEGGAAPPPEGRQGWLSSCPTCWPQARAQLWGSGCHCREGLWDPGRRNALLSADPSTSELGGWGQHLPGPGEDDRVVGAWAWQCRSVEPAARGCLPPDSGLQPPQATVLGVHQEPALGCRPGLFVPLLLQAALPVAQQHLGGGGPAGPLPQAAPGRGGRQLEGLGEGLCGPGLVPQTQEQAAPGAQVLHPHGELAVPCALHEHQVQVSQRPAALLQLGQAGRPQAQVTGPAATRQDGQ